MVARQFPRARRQRDPASPGQFQLVSVPQSHMTCGTRPPLSPCHLLLTPSFPLRKPKDKVLRETQSPSLLEGDQPPVPLSLVKWVRHLEASRRAGRDAWRAIHCVKPSYLPSERRGGVCGARLWQVTGLRPVPRDQGSGIAPSPC